MILPLRYLHDSLRVLEGWGQPRYFRQRLISISDSAADKNYIELGRPEILITQYKIQQSVQLQNFTPNILLSYFFRPQKMNTL